MMDSVADNLWLTKGARERLEEASEAFARAINAGDEFTYVYNEAEAEMESWRSILTK